MKPPFPSPVPTWHNAVYPAIDPAKREGAHEGHTIIVTGAGSGIGREVAKAFATAGAEHLVLVGRKSSTLNETKSQIGEKCRTSVFEADVTNSSSMQHVASEVGKWDVLIMNAGYIPTPSPAAKTDVEDYWKAYETNVKAIVICAQAFFATANPSRAAALAMIGGALVFPTQMTVGMSGYLVSKLATAKTMEYLAAENPNIFCAAIHPGMVDTDIFRKSGATPDMLPMDDPQLPAAFIVWITLPEAQFLNGKLVWANWDVEELKANAQEISSGPQLTAGINGWPFKHA